jgi:hypothetical protein
MIQSTNDDLIMIIEIDRFITGVFQQNRSVRAAGDYILSVCFGEDTADGNSKNPKFSSLSLHEQEISPKETLN